MSKKSYTKLNDKFENIRSNSNIDPRDNNTIYLFPLNLSWIQREMALERNWGGGEIVPLMDKKPDDSGEYWRTKKAPNKGVELGFLKM